MPGIVSAASLAANQRARSRRDWGEYLTFLAFVVPNLVLLGVFSYWPLVQNISLSFTDWDMISPDKRFVGLANWISVLPVQYQNSEGATHELLKPPEVVANKYVSFLVSGRQFFGLRGTHEVLWKRVTDIRPL